MFYFSAFDEGWKVGAEGSVVRFGGYGMPTSNASSRAPSIVETTARKKGAQPPFLI